MVIFSSEFFVNSVFVNSVADIEINFLIIRRIVDGGIRSPSAITCNNHHNEIYVYDSANAKITFLTDSGRFLVQVIYFDTTFGDKVCIFFLMKTFSVHCTIYGHYFVNLLIKTKLKVNLQFIEEARLLYNPNIGNHYF